MKRVMTMIPYLMILWLTSMLKPFSHAVRGYSSIGIFPGPEEITARYGQFRRYSLACTKRKCMDSIYFHFFGPSNILSQIAVVGLVLALRAYRGDSANCTKKRN